MAVLSLGVLGGTCILGGVEAKDRPAASSINTGMTEERDGLISDMGAQLDRVRRSSVQLSRDQESDPSEDLEGHHLAVEVAAGDQCSLWTAVGCRQDQPSCARLRHVIARSASCRVAGSNDGNCLSGSVLWSTFHRR